MALVYLGSRKASDLDDSSHPSSVFPKSHFLLLEQKDWRALVAPYVVPNLNNSSICPRCRTFDLGTHFDQGDGTQTSLEIVPDMSRMDANCGFCSFLTSLSRYSDGDFWVVNPATGSFKKMYLQGPRGTGSETFRFLNPSMETHFSSIRWPETPAVIDFEVLKEYLTHCIREHGNVCGVGQETPVDKLLVLNCTSRRVEAAPTGAKYVALSYVWGGVTGTGKKLPKTIEDATIITRKLGYNYLWVDQLCIDQNDPNKIVYIRQMDRIYYNADVTIIAAAGENADYGIPGAGSISRQAQRYVNTGRHLLLEKKQHRFQILDGTTWNTRGWTYQEKLLSRRCLVFTDQEAWFTCSRIQADEGSETVPTQVRHLNLQYQLGGQRLNLPDGSLPFTTRVGAWDLTSLILEYSERTLTEPSDVISAFSGILKVFEEATHPTYHVWGVLPVLIWNEKIIKTSPSDAFVCGLCWMPQSTFAPRFRRRPGFPSWSWSGWIGPIAYYSMSVGPGWDPEEQEFDIGVAASVELRDGTVLALSDLAKQPHLREQPELISPFIHLDAWTIDVRLSLAEELGSQWGSGMVWAQVELKDGTRAFLKAEVLTIARGKADGENFGPLRGKSVTGILLCSLQQPDWQFVMLVEEKPTWAERIGRIDARRFMHGSGGVSTKNLVRNKDGDLVFDLNLLLVTRREIRLG